MKNLFKILISYIKHYKVICAWGVVIRHSEISRLNCRIHYKSLILLSSFQGYVTINSRSSIIKSVLKGYNKVGENCQLVDVELGQFSYFAGNAMVNNCNVGMYCSVAEGVKIGLSSHPTNFISTSPLFYSSGNTFNYQLVVENSFEANRKNFIGNDVWIGVNAIIMDGITVGNGAIIGAGAIVTHDVPAYAIVVGVPAKLIKYRYAAEVINQLEKLKWWDKDLNWIKKNKLFFQKPILDVNDFIDLRS
jgi:acetyltransferase-like isoleucine patch superfamily enzyme